MGVSSVCIVHCVALPVAILLMPLWPVAAALHGVVHVLFALVIIPTTLAAMYFGLRRHGSRVVASILGVGLVAVLAALVIEFRSANWIAETGVTVAGSTLLIVGHWRNWRRTQSFTCGGAPREMEGRPCGD